MRTFCSFRGLTLLIFCILLLNCHPLFDMQFENEEYDFGDLIAGEDLYYEFVFKNTGRETLIVSHVQTSCVCIRTSPWDRIIAPGEQGKIPLSFTAPELNGPVKKLVFVKTNVPQRPSIHLTLKGSVIIPIQIVSQNRWLGEVGTGSVRGSFELRNNLPVPLKIMEINPPEMDIEYSLITLEEDKRFRLNYKISPPFPGKGKVSQRFTLKTNIKEYEFLELQFFYSIP